MTGIEWLRTLHTKQLLIIKNQSYENFHISGQSRCGDMFFTYEELKKVLSERPHIPNGIESKCLRKIAAKKKIRL